MFDDTLFAQELRRRLKLVVDWKGVSMAHVSTEAGGSATSLKDFIAGRKQSPKLETFLAWSRVLGVPYNIFIDGIGYDLNAHPDFNIDSEGLKSLAPAARVIRIQSARNLKFLREALGKTRMDFAAAASTDGEAPISVALIEAYETGEEEIPQMVALRLSKAFGFGLDDLYE